MAARLHIVLVLALVALFGAPRLSLAQHATQLQAKWHRVKVARVAPAAEELVRLTIDLAGTELAESYETPGQYIQIRTSATEKAGFFAIASAPGETRWELLIKTGTRHGGDTPLPGLSDQLAAMAAGAEVEVTPAQGSGFPLAEHAGKDVVILAMGSGVSACRALLEHILKHRAQYGAVTLIAGGRTPAHLAYRERAEAWIKAGARVIFTISRPDAATPWSGATGYVQDQLTREMLTARPCALFAIGSKDMMMELNSKLGEKGMPDIKPITNF